MLEQLVATIFEGSAPGTIRAFVMEEESSLDSDRYWRDDPSSMAFERHIDGRKQSLTRPLRQQTIIDYRKKFSENLEREIFGEDIKITITEEHPSNFLQVEFEDSTYYTQFYRDSNLVELYHKIRKHHEYFFPPK